MKNSAPHAPPSTLHRPRLGVPGQHSSLTPPSHQSLKHFPPPKPAYVTRDPQSVRPADQRLPQPSRLEEATESIHPLQKVGALEQTTIKLGSGPGASYIQVKRSDHLRELCSLTARRSSLILITTGNPQVLMPVRDLTDEQRMALDDEGYRLEHLLERTVWPAGSALGEMIAGMPQIGEI